MIYTVYIIYNQGFILGVTTSDYRWSPRQKYKKDGWSLR